MKVKKTKSEIGRIGTQVVTRCELSIILMNFEKKFILMNF